MLTNLSHATGRTFSGWSVAAKPTKTSKKGNLHWKKSLSMKGEALYSATLQHDRGRWRHPVRLVMKIIPIFVFLSPFAFLFGYFFKDCELLAVKRPLAAQPRVSGERWCDLKRCLLCELPDESLFYECAIHYTPLSKRCCITFYSRHWATDEAIDWTMVTQTSRPLSTALAIESNRWLFLLMVLMGLCVITAAFRWP